MHNNLAIAAETLLSESQKPNPKVREDIEDVQASNLVQQEGALQDHSSHQSLHIVLIHRNLGKFRFPSLFLPKVRRLLYLKKKPGNICLQK